MLAGSRSGGSLVGRAPHPPSPVAMCSSCAAVKGTAILQRLDTRMSWHGAVMRAFAFVRWADMLASCSFRNDCTYQ